MIETKRTLFDGRAGEDMAQVWLEADGPGAVIRTQSWGPGVERHFGFDTIETCRSTFSSDSRRTSDDLRGIRA